MISSTNWRQIGPTVTTAKSVQGLEKALRRGRVGNIGYRAIVAEASSTTTLPDVIRCVAAATGNVTISGLQTVDGVSLPAGALVLLPAQTTASQNGVYLVSATAWEKIYTEAQLVNALVRVLSGTTNGGRWYGTIDGTTWRYLVHDNEFSTHTATVASTSVLGHVKVDGSTIAVNGSGVISTPADATNQRVKISSGGTTVGTRPTVNFTATGSVDLTVTDNPGSNRVDVAIAGTGPTGSGTANRLAIWSSGSALGDSSIEYDHTDGKWRIPWESGDTKSTLVIGSSSSSNAMNAIEANTYSGTAVRASAADGIALRAIATSGIGLSITTTSGQAIDITTGATAAGPAVRVSQGASTQPAVAVTSSGSSYGLSVQTFGSASTAVAIFAQANGSGPSIEAYKDTTSFHALQGRINASTSTYAGVFGWSNGAAGGAGVLGKNTGSGSGVRAEVDATSNAAPALYASHNGATGSLGLHVVMSGSGRGALLEITNSSSTRDVLELATTGSGRGLYTSNSGSGTCIQAVATGTGRAALFQNSAASGTVPVVEISQTSSGDGLAVTATGSGRVASFGLNNSSATAHAVVITNTGTGRGLDITTAGIGIAVTSSSNGTAAISVFSTGTSRAGFFGRNASTATLPVIDIIQDHASSSAHALQAIQDGTGAGAYLEATGTGNAAILVYSGSTTSSTTANNLLIGYAGTTRVCRIDSTGKLFANGGTQASGADFAELMAVEGSPAGYSPGDVLVISTTADRTVKKSSSSAMGTLAGVYSTFPGFTGSEQGADEEELALMIPVAFIGIVPVKVTNEGGPILRGDLLVTSGTPGAAKKAGSSPDPLTIIGRALEPMAGASGTILARINML